MPPSNGVSSGPNTVAFQRNRLSWKAGLALQPSGGAWLICSRQLWRQLLLHAPCCCATCDSHLLQVGRKSELRRG